jgi:hypothetical protein
VKPLLVRMTTGTLNAGVRCQASEYDLLDVVLRFCLWPLSVRF